MPKLFSSISLMVFLTVIEVFAGSRGIMLCSKVRRSGETNQWWLSFAQLDKSPRWNPSKGAPPLSLEAAIVKTQEWIAKTEGQHYFDIDSIQINSLRSDDRRDRYFFYYKIECALGPFDRTYCVVLMDGSVLEPRTPEMRR